VEGVEKPTYVYPPSLKAVIRAIIPGDIADYTDPIGSRVSNSKVLYFHHPQRFLLEHPESVC
jgi:hypothetical protein